MAAVIVEHIIGLMVRYTLAMLIGFRLLGAVDTARIDAVLAGYDKPETPGCVLAAMKDGRVIHERAGGMANLELGIPLTRRSVFEIASASKSASLSSGPTSIGDARSACRSKRSSPATVAQRTRPSDSSEKNIDRASMCSSMRAALPLVSLTR